ncbi:Rubrerythrin-2 [Clostridium thermosuccinogenes]|uniref:Rubrerythrin-2 n=1 Tax=Clostridium thermosuccinogenes TaxID=84032 RepID=A0A2K2FS46_9CLOT|nr:rubrerythrin family protein [Pseudoclostridium thermosuccinogenes]AUS97985.1 Rubrerythrin-2 [Pseudoclostridium thermosuccinogenes]PNU00283.1 Rubrerythrin-2 [Pseudoclostridium thermosuccinogenes]PNU01607.1 Rubrerythrin-2 [Pseudoclostridium thermosuccinogenes]
MPVRNDMTADFLRSAYGGESMAHMRYLIWGDMAEKEGMPNIGRLFRAIAYAEWAHADNHFKVLKEKVGGASVTAGAVFGAGKTADNLQGAIDGELHEVEQMYPVYLNAAIFQQEKDAERAFRFALEAEKIHVKLFQEAQVAAKQGKDMELGPVYVCPVCGHTIKDHLPDVCPVCGAKKEMYKHFTA